MRVVSGLLLVVAASLVAVFVVLASVAEQAPAGCDRSSVLLHLTSLSEAN